MRVLVIVKSTKDYEEGQMPTQQALADMNNFNEELVKNGIMLAGEGLHPSARGKRIKFSGDKVKVIDGPFDKPKDLMAGYWIWKVKSMDEAVEWARRIPTAPGESGEFEIRPIFEMEDFGAEFTPELRAQEERLRDQMGRGAQYH